MTSQSSDKSMTSDSTIQETEPEAVEAPNAPKGTVGGLVEGTWGKSRSKIWRCPRCPYTTFDEGKAKLHTCKKPRRVNN